MLYGLGSHIEALNSAQSVIWEGFVNKIDANFDNFTITLQCEGYAAFLDYEYQNAASGAYTLREKLIQLLTTEPNSIFSTDYSLVETNTLSVLKEELNNKKALQIMKDLIKLGGDSNNNRRIFGITEGRKLLVEEIPSVAEYLTPLPTSVSVGPLTNITNNASTKYKNTDLDVEVLTDEANNTTSQERYGIFRRVLNGGEASQTNAEAIRDVYLNENKDPETSQTFSGTTIVTDINGNQIEPWDVVPGKWLEFTGIPAGLSEEDDLRSDLKYMFVEGVTYTAPINISLTGVKVSRLDQRLAKLGLGGI